MKRDVLGRLHVMNPEGHRGAYAQELGDGSLNRKCDGILRV